MTANFYKVAVLCVVVLVTTTSPSVSADPKVDAKITKLRAAKNSRVIRCSPFGVGDTFKPSEILSKLDRKMTLFLEPGVYRRPIRITRDNLIVEGKPGGVYNMEIILNGENNIIRNISAKKMSVSGDILILDSVIKDLTINGSGKSKCLLANSAFRNVKINSPKKEFDFVMDHCTISNKGTNSKTSKPAIALSGRVSLNIANCVLFSQKPVFSISQGKKKKNVFLELADSYIFGKTILGKKKNRKGKDVDVTDKNDLNKVFTRVTIKGDIINENPLFIKETGETLDNFRLKDKADKKGVAFSEEWLKASNSEGAPDNSSSANIFTALKDAKTISFNPARKWFKSYKIPKKCKMKNSFLTLASGRDGVSLKSLKKYDNFLMEFDVRMKKGPDIKAKEFSLFLRNTEKKFIKIQVTSSRSIITVRRYVNCEEIMRVGKGLSYIKWNNIRIKLSKDTLFIQINRSRPSSIDIAKIPDMGFILFEAVSTEPTLSPTAMDNRLIAIRNLKFLKLQE